jgi:hypothetical protein
MPIETTEITKPAAGSRWIVGPSNNRFEVVVVGASHGAVRCKRYSDGKFDVCMSYRQWDQTHPQRIESNANHD